MEKIVAVNQGKRPLTQNKPIAIPLTPQEAQTELENGAMVIDIRSTAAFGAGHIANALNVQLASGEFEQRVGWMTPKDSPLILVAESETDAQDAIYKAAFVALDDQIKGFISGGIAAWIEAGLPVRTVPQIDVFTLSEQLGKGELKVVDVRDDSEWEAGHIKNATFLPYRQMVPQGERAGRLDELPFAKDEPIAVVCASGMRSSTAVSVLLQNGFSHLHNVTGGMNAWKAANLKTV